MKCDKRTQNIESSVRITVQKNIKKHVNRRKIYVDIRGMSPDIQNLKKMWSTAIPAAFRESPVNFGPQTKKFYWLELSHPSGFFGED